MRLTVPRAGVGQIELSARNLSLTLPGCDGRLRIVAGPGGHLTCRHDRERLRLIFNIDS
jgi:hypothetical protein